MSKFGEIIQSSVPVLIDFHINDQKQTISILQDVAINLGAQAKVIRIEVAKNKNLTDALRIEYFPTFIIYKDGEMKWRQSGNQDATLLIHQLEQYI